VLLLKLRLQIQEHLFFELQKDLNLPGVIDRKRRKPLFDILFRRLFIIKNVKSIVREFSSSVSTVKVRSPMAKLSFTAADALNAMINADKRTLILFIHAKSLSEY
jgi:hypothetical protein